MEEQDIIIDYVLPLIHKHNEGGAKEQQQVVAIDGQRGSVRSEVCAVDRVKGMFVGASERRGIFSHYVPPADLLVLWVYIADPPPQGRCLGVDGEAALQLEKHVRQAIPRRWCVTIKKGSTLMTKLKEEYEMGALS